jgi:hypothetical protein
MTKFKDTTSVWGHKFISFHKFDEYVQNAFNPALGFVLWNVYELTKGHHIGLLKDIVQGTLQHVRFFFFFCTDFSTQKWKQCVYLFFPSIFKTFCFLISEVGINYLKLAIPVGSCLVLKDFTGCYYLTSNTLLILFFPFWFLFSFMFSLNL